MKINIETIANIGDTLYGISAVTKRMLRPCLACKNTKRVMVTAPDGTDYDIDCPRCINTTCSTEELQYLDYSLNLEKITKISFFNDEVAVYNDKISDDTLKNDRDYAGNICGTGSLSQMYLSEKECEEVIGKLNEKEVQKVEQFLKGD